MRLRCTDPFCYVNVSEHESKADTDKVLWGQSFRIGKKTKSFLKGHFFLSTLFPCNLWSVIQCEIEGPRLVPSLKKNGNSNFKIPVILHDAYSFLWIPSVITQLNLMRAEYYLPIREAALAIVAMPYILFFKSFLIGCNISNIKFVLQVNNKTEFSLQSLWVCLYW